MRIYIILLALKYGFYDRGPFSLGIEAFKLFLGHWLEFGENGIRGTGPIFYKYVHSWDFDGFLDFRMLFLVG